MSSRIVFWGFIGVIVLIAVLVIEIGTAEASMQADFVPVSVLADNEADYGVDEGLPPIPSISVDLVMDKLNEEGKTSFSLPVILLTSDDSPQDDNSNQNDGSNPETDVPGNTTDEPQDENEGNHGNGNGNGNGNNGNGNGGSNGNGNGNGNGGSNGNGNGNNGNGNGNGGSNANGDGNNGNGNGNGGSNANGNGNGGGNGNGNGNNSSQAK